jgi:hypothetical protein
MSDPLNQLITVIDSLLAYSKNTHATAVREVELKLSNNELLDLFAAKLASINEPPFITAESFEKRLTLFENTINKSISNSIAEVQSSFNAKLDNLAKTQREEVKRLTSVLSEIEPKLQEVLQKQDAALKSVKNEFANKLSATESKLQDLVNNKSQASQHTIEVLSESTKRQIIDNKQNIQDELTTEFHNSLNIVKSETNSRFKLIAKLLTDAKLPIIGRIFKDKQDQIKQLIVDTHTPLSSVVIQQAKPEIPALAKKVESPEQDDLFELLLKRLKPFKFKSDDKKDEFINKLKKATQDSKPKKSLDGMNFGAYLDIDKKNWTEIIDDAINSAGKK